jgi:hypothetical protein
MMIPDISIQRGGIQWGQPFPQAVGSQPLLIRDGRGLMIRLFESRGHLGELRIDQAQVYHTESLMSVHVAGVLSVNVDGPLAHRSFALGYLESEAQAVKTGTLAATGFLFESAPRRTRKGRIRYDPANYLIEIFRPRTV